MAKKDWRVETRFGCGENTDIECTKPYQTQIESDTTANRGITRSIHSSSKCVSLFHQEQHTGSPSSFSEFLVSSVTSRGKMSPVMSLYVCVCHEAKECVIYMCVCHEAKECVIYMCVCHEANGCVIYVCVCHEANGCVIYVCVCHEAKDL